MTTSTPRISLPHLETFTSRTVRILGTVTQLRGETALIDSQGIITAHLNRDSHLTVGNAVEIVGKVNSDLSIRVLKSTDWGVGVDFNAVNAVVDATHRYKEIFYTD